jgi:hypothetical protein
MIGGTMMNPSSDVNTVFMAANWVKAHSVQRNGTSTMFVTTMDKPMPSKLNAVKKQEGNKEADKKTIEGGQDDLKPIQREGHLF